VARGEFLPQSPEGTVLELQRMIRGIQAPVFLACDHGNNYVRVNGRLPEARGRMLRELERFLALPASKRNAAYQQTGSRL